MQYLGEICAAQRSRGLFWQDKNHVKPRKEIQKRSFWRRFFSSFLSLLKEKRPPEAKRGKCPAPGRGISLHHFWERKYPVGDKSVPPHTARKGMCARETLVGFPLRVQSKAALARPGFLHCKKPRAEEHAKKITTRKGGDFWSGRRGSNSLPRPWQGRALPDELRPQTQGELYRIFPGLSTLHFHIVKISSAIPAGSPPFPHRPRGRSSPSSSCRPGPRGPTPRSA